MRPHSRSITILRATTPRVIRHVVAMMVVSLLGACHTWHTGTLSPGQNMTWNDQVRVTLVSGQDVVLLNARVQGDTLRGAPLYGREDSVARYPLEMVRQIEQRQFSGDRTAVVVVFSVVGTVMLTLAALGAVFSGLINE